MELSSLSISECSITKQALAIPVSAFIPLILSFLLFLNSDGIYYSRSGITKFGESTTYDLGWSDVILKLDDLRNHKQITLGCYIKILCIEQDEPDNDNLIIYECPLRLEHPLLRCSLSDGFKFSIQWKLSDSERDLMQSARPGQSYESKIMAEMFCFRLFPMESIPLPRERSFYVFSFVCYRRGYRS